MKHQSLKGLIYSMLCLCVSTSSHKPGFNYPTVYIHSCVLLLQTCPWAFISLTNSFTICIFLVDFSHNVAYEQINELKSALGPLSAHGEKYCSDTCLRRYLEARNWNVTKSRKMLEESLKWRATYKPEDIRWVNVLKLLCSLNPGQVTKHHANCLSA